MVKGALAHLENVEIVTSTQELAVTVARNLGVITLIRGFAQCTGSSIRSQYGLF